MNKTYNMNAGEVTLDLNKLVSTLGAAVRAAKERLYHEQNEIQNEIEQACFALARGDKDAHYRGLSHANTGKQWMVRAATDYSNAIEAYFHVCEAIKRDEVKFVK